MNRSIEIYEERMKNFNKQIKVYEEIEQMLELIKKGKVNRMSGKEVKIYYERLKQNNYVINKNLID